MSELTLVVDCSVLVLLISAVLRLPDDLEPLFPTGCIQSQSVEKSADVNLMAEETFEDFWTVIGGTSRRRRLTSFAQTVWLQARLLSGPTLESKGPLPHKVGQTYF